MRAGVVTVPEGTSEIATSLLEDYGLAALFVIFVIEGVMLLYFAPSESLVPGAILLLGDSPPQLVAILAVAVVGATTGQLVLFLVAKRGGRDLLERQRWVDVSDERMARFDAWFDRWGTMAVPASNTMLFTRGMLTVPAGLAEMDARRFALLSALGTLSFELILAGITLGVLNVL
ncbi:DedA family protein [Halobacteriales archaeon Cl-PHB]